MRKNKISTTKAKNIILLFAINLIAFFNFKIYAYSEANNDYLYPVRIDNKFGFINNKGKIIIKPEFEKAGTFFEGLAPFSQDDKSGFIDKSGKIIIKPEFDKVGYFLNNLAPVLIKNNLLLINKSGNIVFSLNSKKYINLKTKKIMEINNQRGIRLLDYDNMGYITKNAANQEIIKILTFEQYSKLFPNLNQLFGVQINGKVGFNKVNKLIIPLKFDIAYGFSEEFARAKIDKKYGFINEIGEFVIKPMFTAATDFKNGFSVVSLDSYPFGIIDKKGNILIEPQFDRLEVFSEGLAVAKKSGSKYGYIDISSKFVISEQFENAESFLGDLAKVETDEEYAYINRLGKIVWSTRKENEKLVKNNMIKLESLIIMYYIDNKNSCPKTFNDLFKDAAKDNYLKVIKNPYSESTEIKDNFITLSDYTKHKDKKQVKGFVLFDFNIKPNFCGNIYGTDGEGNLITKNNAILTYEVSF
ncbi:MAG: WG repeat-containing protein [Candidatus Sericytochromatia bacterium]|nr:WG repeat-containing protein [Candidatus Sericytochromatia bacterium]